MSDNNNENRIYIAIDLKSFYASVECVERGLNPLLTNLVVADRSRTSKTICLAVSPSLKAYGIPGRARLFEVEQKLKEVNAQRRTKAPGHNLVKKSYIAPDLELHPEYEVDFIAAPPRMAQYLKVSTEIYNIYLKYISKDDIHVYSIDEVFMDVTHYLNIYKMSPKELAMEMIRDILRTTGITATAGIGTNMYLCKVAMDIVAKHVPADENGVRIAELNEQTYREKLWDHKGLTDFWRLGRGYAKKLMDNGLYTMGDIARCSLGKSHEFYNEDLLYKLFGINAELLIDHAWGYEPCTIADIKAYKPENNSISSGQVLHCAYDNEKGRLILREMTDLMVLDLVDKRLVTDQIVLTVGYDIENLQDSELRKAYKGEITTDHYGRKVPKPAHGSINLGDYTSSTELIMKAVLELYDRIVDKNLLVRRFTVCANHLIDEQKKPDKTEFEQLDLFTDYNELELQRQKEKEKRQKERSIQEAMLSIQKRYGKNAILKGNNLEEGAMTIARNSQIGGHKS